MDPESTISITYTIHVNEIPDDVGLVENVVTITGEDPNGYICEEDNQFCSQVEVVLDPETVVSKSVVDSNGNMILEDGETLHYTINVTNPNTIVSATNVSVRDSLLENMDKYPFLTWVDTAGDTFGDITITDSTGNPASFIGDLADGSLILSEVKAGETVTIEYDIEVTDTLPKGELNVLNIATDDGAGPSIIDSEICSTSEDCSSTVTPLDGATVIEKSMTDEDGDMVIDKITSGEVVTITYSLTANDLIPEGVEALNVVTNNGIDSATIDPDSCKENDTCSSKLTPIKHIENETGSETGENKSDNEEMSISDKVLAVTGSRGALILVDLFMILAIGFTLKRCVTKF